MKRIDIHFFDRILATYSNEAKRPILKWCNWYFNGVKEPYIEIELLLATLFDPATDLVTECKIKNIDDLESLKYETIYETVEISDTAIDRFYSMDFTEDANVYYIKMDTLIANVRNQIIFPNGYTYKEEFEGRDQYLIQRIE